MKSPLSKKDHRYKTISGYGVDVSSVRIDDLDRKILFHIKHKSDAKVLDLGCGWGGQSVRMAKAGAEVVAVDLVDLTDHFADLRASEQPALEKLDFIQADIGCLRESLSSAKFTDAYANRTLHYLDYKKTLETLKYLREITSDRLYVSVSGISSALGDYYPTKNRALAERFAHLEREAQETFQLLKPICLYSEVEFAGLLAASGWRALELYESAFGNLKAVCE